MKLDYYYFAFFVINTCTINYWKCLRDKTFSEQSKSSNLLFPNQIAKWQPLVSILRDTPGMTR